VRVLIDLKQSIQARAILALKKEGMTEAEIRIALAISRATLRRRLHKARSIRVPMASAN
jgi:DNA-directed RNA polymerase specialized sigma24 family protein